MLYLLCRAVCSLRRTALQARCSLHFKVRNTPRALTRGYPVMQNHWSLAEWSPRSDAFSEALRRWMAVCVRASPSDVVLHTLWNVHCMHVQPRDKA